MDKLTRLPEIARALDLDRTIHEPARLVILSILHSVESADFSYLMAETGLTQGNLSTHLTKLEDAGLVDILKEFQGKRPRTVLKITAAGRTGLAAHGKALTQLFRMLGIG
ncbi:MAG: transcriptional regulator [Hyphomonas sp.]|uniref:winged helix-turn-helix domain-containing protein n=1 Tax=Hyphomonas sp. TaxID=87 RepID=UPI00352748FF